MSLLEDNARMILTAALNSETGIQILVESPEPIAAMTSRAKQVLYRFKRENADYAVLRILFCPDDPDKRLWIVKDNQETPESSRERTPRERPGPIELL